MTLMPLLWGDYDDTSGRGGVGNCPQIAQPNTGLSSLRQVLTTDRRELTPWCTRETSSSGFSEPLHASLALSSTYFPNEKALLLREEVPRDPRTPQSWTAQVPCPFLRACAGNNSA